MKKLGILLCSVVLCMCSLQAQIGNYLDTGDGEWSLGAFQYMKIGVFQKRESSVVSVNGNDPAELLFMHSPLVGLQSLSLRDPDDLGRSLSLAGSTAYDSNLYGSFAGLPDGKGIFIPLTDELQKRGILFSDFHFPLYLTETSGQRLDGDIENVIILVHGYNPFDESDMFAGAFADLSHNLETVLAGKPWGLVEYDWAKDSATGTPTSKIGPWFPYIPPIEAASAGDGHGRHLSFLLLSQHIKLKRVMLLCHSAGSWVGYRTTKYLNQLNPLVEVELILMDPFIPESTFGGAGITPLSVERMSTLDENGGERVRLHNYYGEDGFDTLASCLREAGFGNSVTYGTEEEFDWVGAQHTQFRVESVYDLGIGDPCDYGGHQGPIEFVSDSVRRYMGFLPEKWDTQWDGKYGLQNSLFARWARGEPGNIEIGPPLLNIADYTFDDLYPNGLPMASIDPGLIGFPSGIGGSPEEPSDPPPSGGGTGGSNEPPVNPPSDGAVSLGLYVDCNRNGLFVRAEFSPVNGAKKYLVYKDSKNIGGQTIAENTVNSTKPHFDYGVEVGETYVYRVEAFDSDNVSLGSGASQISIPAGLCPGIHQYTPTGLTAKPVKNGYVELYIDPILDPPSNLQIVFQRFDERGKSETFVVGASYFSVAGKAYNEVKFAKGEFGTYEYLARAQYYGDEANHSPETERVSVTLLDSSKYHETERVDITNELWGIQSFRSEGDGYVHSENRLELPDIFSLEGRVKMVDTGKSQTILETRKTVDSLLRVETGASGELVLLYRHSGNRTEYKVDDFLIASNQNTWKTFIFTVDVKQQVVHAYINGVKTDGYYTFREASSIGETFGDISIGGVPFSSEQFHGDIDYLRIWSIVLSEHEIVRNHATPYFDTEEGLIMSWNFDGRISDFAGRYDLAAYGTGIALVPIPHSEIAVVTETTVNVIPSGGGLLENPADLKNPVLEDPDPLLFAHDPGMFVGIEEKPFVPVVTAVTVEEKGIETQAPEIIVVPSILAPPVIEVVEEDYTGVQTLYDGADGKVVLTYERIEENLFSLHLFTRPHKNSQVEVSSDKKEWSTVFVMRANGSSANLTFRTDTSNYGEGYIFFRVVGVE